MKLARPMPPLQGLKLLFAQLTQGCALGSHITPFQGVNKQLNCRRYR
jgi:hypothetical protein